MIRGVSPRVENSKYAKHRGVQGVARLLLGKSVREFFQGGNVKSAKLTTSGQLSKFDDGPIKGKMYKKKIQSEVGQVGEIFGHVPESFPIGWGFLWGKSHGRPRQRGWVAGEPTSSRAVI